MLEGVLRAGEIDDVRDELTPHPQGRHFGRNDGEKAQSWHYDDGYGAIPRPRDALGVSTICDIDDFSDDNGATEVIPGSHRFDDELPVPDDADVGRVTMPAGSVLVFLGTL